MKLFQTLALGLTLAASAQADTQIKWPADSRQSLTKTIEAGEYGTVTSLLVQRNGETLYEQYFHGTDKNTQHNTRSVTKTVIGLLVGAAISDGLIANENESVTAFFPEMIPFKHPDVRKDRITLMDFLTMSSLLECNDFNRFSRGNEERMYLMEDWVRFTLDLPIKGYAPWEPRPDASPYGRAFSYCSAGVHTLGQVVARASDKPLSKYAEERLFKPLDISRATWPKTSLGRDGGAGGLELTSRDLAKLGSLYINNGRYGGTSVVPASWIEASLTTQVDTGSGGHKYGYLIWQKTVDVEGRQVLLNYMSGNGGNKVVFVPELEFVIVITKTDYNRSGMHEQADNLIKEGVLKRLLANTSRQ